MRRRLTARRCKRQRRRLVTVTVSIDMYETRVQVLRSFFSSSLSNAERVVAAADV